MKKDQENIYKLKASQSYWLWIAVFITLILLVFSAVEREASIICSNSNSNISCVLYRHSLLGFRRTAYKFIASNFIKAEISEVVVPRRTKLKYRLDLLFRSNDDSNSIVTKDFIFYNDRDVAYNTNDIINENIHNIKNICNNNSNGCYKISSNDYIKVPVNMRMYQVIGFILLTLFIILINLYGSVSDEWHFDSKEYTVTQYQMNMIFQKKVVMKMSLHSFKNITLEEKVMPPKKGVIMKLFWLQLNRHNSSDNDNNSNTTFSKDILKNSIIVGEMSHYPEKLKREWIIIDNLMKNGKPNYIQR